MAKSPAPGTRGLMLADEGTSTSPAAAACGLPAHEAVEEDSPRARHAPANDWLVSH